MEAMEWLRFDPESTPAPHRSRLYHLAPASLGLAGVESLTSYIKRLAVEHCVRVGTLMACEFLPLFGRSYIRIEGKIEGAFWRKTVAFNGTGRWAGDCVRTLAALTGRDDLRYSTLLTWGEVLSSRGLLRRTSAWCPYCLEEWRSTGDVVREPLLWALEVVEVCARHGTPLSTVCPHESCGKRPPLLSPRARPGCCSQCDHWLGRKALARVVADAGPLARSSPGETDTAVQKKAGVATGASVVRTGERSLAWVGVAVGELLSAAPGSVAPPRERLASTMSRCLERLAAGDVVELSHLVGLSKRSLRDVLAGDQVLQLSTLLRACARLGVTPLDFLAKDARLWLAASVPDKAIPRSRRARRTVRRGPRPFDAEALAKALREVLLGGELPPPSMREVATRLGYDASHLHRRLPALCEAISARHAEYRKVRKLERMEGLRVAVVRAASEVHEGGEYPSYRRTRSRLSKPRLMYEQEAVAVWHSTLMGLGWKE